MNKKKGGGEIRNANCNEHEKKPERQKRMNKQTERQQQQKIVPNDC